MAYKSDKEVVFALMRRVDFNEAWEDIKFGLGYDMGDYRFGKGDSKVLRDKIISTIKYMKEQFDGVFDENNNTKENV